MSVKNDLEEQPGVWRGVCGSFFSCCRDGMCIESLLRTVSLRNKIIDDPNSIEMIMHDATLYYHSQPVNENK